MGNSAGSIRISLDKRNEIYVYMKNASCMRYGREIPENNQKSLYGKWINFSVVARKFGISDKTAKKIWFEHEGIKK